jgi:hypothetical protein
MVVQSTNFDTVGSDGGHIGCRITLIKQDWWNNLSVVGVEGLLRNNSSGRVTHADKNIPRFISGDGGYHPDDFNINMAKDAEIVFISHHFTLKHGDDGNRTASFTVRYGKTNMTVFPNDGTVSDSLDLPHIPSQYQEVSATGRMACRVTQGKQNYNNFTSEVRVQGYLANDGDTESNHLASNISRSISGDGGFNPDGFSISLKPGEQMIFIQRTFTIKHKDDGTRTVNFTVKYGKTGLDRFPDDESVSSQLDLDAIPIRPGAPDQPQFSNEAPTKLTITWNTPVDGDGNEANGGGTIDNYVLRRYIGTDTTGNHFDYPGNDTTRNITDLDPGETYTFTVLAHNNSSQSNGFSPPSDPNTITTTAGVWIRYGGVWKKAIPYIRVSGQWKQAITYVRSGTWKQTK